MNDDKADMLLRERMDSSGAIKSTRESIEPPPWYELVWDALMYVLPTKREHPFPFRRKP
jgi:hypothetical protein